MELEDRTICKLCGKEYMSLTAHITNRYSHHISDHEYKDMFGLPYGLPLEHPDKINKHSRYIHKLIEEKIFIPGHHGQRVVHNSSCFSRKKRTADNAQFKKQYPDRICPYCKKPFPVNSHTGRKKFCTISCSTTFAWLKRKENMEAK